MCSSRSRKRCACAPGNATASEPLHPSTLRCRLCACVPVEESRCADRAAESGAHAPLPFTHRRTMTGRGPTISPGSSTSWAWLCCRPSAARTRTPRSGPCIVDTRKRIVAIGYAGFPTGCSDDDLPWEREGPLLETKYPYVCHAELNAILNRNKPTSTAAPSTPPSSPATSAPRRSCSQASSEVVYLSDKHRDSDTDKASRTILEMAGVKSAPIHGEARHRPADGRCRLDDRARRCTASSGAVPED